MNILATPSSLAAQVAAAPEWWYFGGLYAWPRHNSNVIALDSRAEEGEWARVPEVFSALGLVPDDLCEIFTWRTASTPVLTFEDLGGCPPEDKNWSRFARITGKIIHRVHCSGQERSGSEIAVYYPDGRIEKK